MTNLEAGKTGEGSIAQFLTRRVPTCPCKNEEGETCGGAPEATFWGTPAGGIRAVYVCPTCTGVWDHAGQPLGFLPEEEGDGE